MYTLLIKNAKVIDGTGKGGEILDVAVQNDEIVNIDKNIATSAQTVIDGSGKILCPGFIDIQNHSDVYWQLFDNPTLDSLITQGFTTILVGNCGTSLAPLISKQSILSIQKWHSSEGLNINWQSFEEFLQTLSKTKIACNVGSLVGYSTLRRGLVGDQIRPLEKSELSTIKKILEESLQAGAFGLSSGLSYAHEVTITELELFELANIVKKQNALFSIHLRNEGDSVIESLEEALDITRNTEVNTKISHLKVRGKQNWHKAEQLENILDTSYHQGLPIHFDVYPYHTMWQPLYSYLPKWAIEGGRQTMIKHFEDTAQRNKILSFLNNSGVKFSEILVASTTNKLNFTGKSIGQIAKNMEVTSEQAVLHLIQNGGSEVLVFEKNLDEAQVEHFTNHPLSFISTDGGGFNLGQKDKLVHPRAFGSATKFLSQSIKTKKITLEQAIRKLTLGPAEKIGLKKRGSIQVGNFADLLLFNPYTVSDRSTYENPYMFSEGIEYVFVNGRPVVFKNQITNNLPGYILKKK